MARPHEPNRLTSAEIRRIRRLLLAALLLAWATQLLVTQWARAAAHQPSQGSPAEATVIVHMRPSAQVTGSAVTLDDVCFLEWHGAHTSAETLGKMIVVTNRSTETRLFVGIEQVVQAVTTANVRPEKIQITGPIRCEVRFIRNEDKLATTSQEALLLAWANLADQQSPTAVVGETPRQRTREPDADFMGAHGTLGEVLRRDLARQLCLPLESIHLRFAREDAPLVQSTDIAARQVHPLRISDLGQVAWMVELDGRENAIFAEASATVTRALAMRPIGQGQLIRAADLDGQQVRISRLAERGVAPGEAAGQEAARALPAGEVLTKQSLAPRMLVRRGQLVTVEMVRSGVQIRALATALEDGVMGQIVKAQSDLSGEVLHITMIAPQAGRLVEASGENATASSEGDAVPKK